ncbi:MAG: serine/threonine-protein phosphatase [Anaerolineales bacterium]|nr:serine/threonine-protein phosphatase [Anaerolineales bacterium]
MNFLQRLLSQPKAEPESTRQAAGKSSDQAAAPVKGHSQLSPGLHVGKLSDIGQVRERNEDSLFAVQSLLQHDDGQEWFGLFIVADGMGGHQKGELASSLAVRTAAECILKEIYLSFLTNNNNQGAASRPINEVLIGAVERANTVVQEAVPDGGTTLTVALVMGHSAYIAHVGDSRAYWFNQGNLKQVTKDHSLVQRLVELGQETAEGALTHPQRNVLYRAIGQGTAMEVDIYVQHLPPGSSLLLCSDGLWGPVKNEVLREIIGTSGNPQEACQRLIAAANKNGGEDNITVVMVSVGLEN